MDIRIILLAVALFVNAVTSSEEEDFTVDYSDLPGPPYIETARVKKLTVLSKLNQFRKLNFTQVLEKAANYMTERKDINNHFDSTSFCFDSVVGSTARSLKERMSQQKFIVSTALLLKCVAVTDAAVLPYNIYQDFKNAVTEFRRETSWTTFISRFFELPFIVARTILLQPARTISRMSAVAVGSIITYADVYG